jgi:hypothetical protein
MCEKLGGKAFRVNLANGFDLSTRSGIDRALHEAALQKPREAWISIPCTPWTSTENFNVHRNPEKLAKQRKDSRRMMRLVTELTVLLLQQGAKVAFEYPLRASAWGLDEMQTICKHLPYCCKTDGCCYGMRTIDTDELVLKQRRIQCSHGDMPGRLPFRCQKTHKHATLEGHSK